MIVSATNSDTSWPATRIAHPVSQSLPSKRFYLMSPPLTFIRPQDPRHASAEYTRISYCTNANFFLGGTSSYSSIANGTVSTTSGSNSFSTIDSSSATYTDASSSNSTVSSSASSASSTAAPAATDSGAGGKVFSPAGSFLTAMFGLAVVL
jgi:hypothetical protein